MAAVYVSGRKLKLADTESKNTQQEMYAFLKYVIKTFLCEASRCVQISSGLLWLKRRSLIIKKAVNKLKLADIEW